MTGAKSNRRPHGFTLVELLIVVAVIAIVALLAAPSLRDFILLQRLKSIHAQLVTDIHFARAEAAARGSFVRIAFRSGTTSPGSEAVTCYTLYTVPNEDGAIRCNCLLGAGSACPAGATEIRSAILPVSRSVRIEIPDAASALAFSPINGGLWLIPIDSPMSEINAFRVDTKIDDDRQLRVIMNRTGRPSVCRLPIALRMQEPLCPA